MGEIMHMCMLMGQVCVAGDVAMRGKEENDWSSVLRREGVGSGVQWRGWPESRARAVHNTRRKDGHRYRE